MNKIKLIAPEFMNPAWFNTVKHRSFEKIAVENNAVVIEGETLRLASPLADETSVRVYFAADFYAVLESDLAAEEERRREERRQDAERRRRLFNERRRLAVAFNATINLPVAWRISQKEVLSGLSANSSGDGCYKNTVQHIELLDEFCAGRLRRRQNDFLCTAQAGSNGHSWSDGNFGITYKDGDGNDYTPQPTCKQCLKLVERFRKISPESV